MLIPPSLREHSSEPIYTQIYHFYKKGLLSGQIKPHSKLPSIRQLAQHLNTSRNPVETAYAQLVAEGFIGGRPKSGYYALELELLQPLDAQATTDDFPISKDDSPLNDKRPVPTLIGFDYDQTAVEYFPLAKWRKYTMMTLQPSDYSLLEYGDRKGEQLLRVLIAQYVRLNRGVACEPEQVLVTAGTQQSTSLLCSLLQKDYRVIGVEQAMHPGVLQVFQLHLNPTPLTLEQDGLCVDQLYLNRSIRAVYVTPSHQFPYGMTMSAAKRLKLLHWAKQTNGIIIEDDYDSDFLYEGRPIPALQALDTAGSVIYLGTFSKALAPALRLSYIILPPGLLKRFENEFPYYDQPVSRLTQKTMELFMEQGHFDKHVRKMRKVYKHKRETLLDAIHSNLGDRVELSGTASGLHVIVKIKSERSTVELIRLAAQSGVRVHAVSDYEARLHDDQLESIKQDEVHSFLLGFGGLSSAQITEGISRIAIAWGIHSTRN